MGGNVNPRKQWSIVFVDENHQVEDGVDGGGLFKEFITLLTETIFNPNFSFFSETTHDRTAYPNVLSAVNDPEFRKLFHFFGVIVGKALYEGVLLKVRFAKFFLLRLLSKSNQFDDLKSLDPQVYENLLQVKYYDGDVEDLGLTMTTAVDSFGMSREVELIPNGSNIAVTSHNRPIYIMHLVNYLLNLRTYEQTKAFVRGLKSVFPEDYLGYFFPDEVELLISGGINEIDIDDLRANTVLQGFEPETSVADKNYLDKFWDFLKLMSNEQKEKLLTFATGTNRPPLLGFAYMNPNFCIRKMEVNGPELRYPTASTCAHMMHLPYYGCTEEGLKKMRDTFTYAINSAQGFYNV